MTQHDYVRLRNLFFTTLPEYHKEIFALYDKLYPQLTSSSPQIRLAVTGLLCQQSLKDFIFEASNNYRNKFERMDIFHFLTAIAEFATDATTLRRALNKIPLPESPTEQDSSSTADLSKLFGLDKLNPKEF
jgi:hypothetical protein